GVRHISQSPTSSAEQQMFTTWLLHRLQRLEYLVINELRDVAVLFLQQPEMLLQGLFPNDISIDEVRLIRSPGIERAVRAIREEKLKRFDQILMPLITRLFSSTSPNELLAAVHEMRKLVDGL
ncbi:unnamed protein product, partial [Litomosoides sigmodontis]